MDTLEYIKSYDFYQDAKRMAKYDRVWNNMRRMKLKLSMLYLGRSGTIKDNNQVEGQIKKKPVKLIIREDSPFKIIWSTIINFLYILSFFLVPLVIASNIDLLKRILWLELTIDVFLLVDIFLRFFMEYSVDINKIISHRLIAVRYLSSYFICDFLSVVPSLVTYEEYQPIYYFKLFRYFRLERFFNQVRVLMKQFASLLTNINKKLVDNIMTIIRALLMLGFLIHFMACAWILIGRNNNHGWIDRTIDDDDSSTEYLSAYPSAIYFITVTFTTVGYGDITPYTNWEITFVMMIELLGLAVFSYTLGILKSVERQKSSMGLIIQKKKDIVDFMDKISRNRRDMALPNEIVCKSLQNLDITYNYSFNFVFKSGNFVNYLKPALKKELTIATLHQQYVKYIDFFYCEELKFQASDNFIRDILVNLECTVFLPGGNIINRGEQLENLYFVEKGEVLVSKLMDGEPFAKMPKHSFFGDYQILLDTCSNVSFKATRKDYVVTYCLPKKRFLKLMNGFPDHYPFYFDRAICNRQLFKRLAALQEAEASDSEFAARLQSKGAYNNYEDSQSFDSHDGGNTKKKAKPKPKKKAKTKEDIKEQHFENIAETYMQKGLNIDDLIISENNREYFEEQFLTDFTLDRFNDEEKEKDLGYLSDNEIQHHINDDSIYNLIRKSNVVYSRLKKLRLSLLIIKSVLTKNLTKIKKQLRFTKKTKLLTKVTSLLSINQKTISTEVNKALAGDAPEQPKQSKFKQSKPKKNSSSHIFKNIKATSDSLKDKMSSTMIRSVINQDQEQRTASNPLGRNNNLEDILDREESNSNYMSDQSST